MVIDLHCDLLGCMATNSALTFNSPETNCSIPQLLQGNVKAQVFALACITGSHAVEAVKTQVKIYKDLLHLQKVIPISNYNPDRNAIHGIFAIENASGLCLEDEPLDRAFERLETYSQTENILYISLTWDHENRFGGGNTTTVGLKDDGKTLLEYINGKKIAIDLSHTSDHLAHDILNYCESQNLDLLPIASHSNFRSITPIARNLPDEIAKAIIALNGVIGINLIRRFVGDRPEDFIRHIEHGLNLGAKNALCLGSDFYGGLKVPQDICPEHTFPTYQKDFCDASCYPQFLAFLSNHLPKNTVDKIASRNAEQLFLRQGLIKPIKI